MVTATRTRRLLRVSEIAKIYGLSRYSLDKLVEAGKLRPIRTGEGGWYRFKVEDVERFLSGEEPERDAP